MIRPETYTGPTRQMGEVSNIEAGLARHVGLEVMLLQATQDLPDGKLSVPDGGGNLEVADYFGVRTLDFLQTSRLPQRKTKLALSVGYDPYPGSDNHYDIDALMTATWFSDSYGPDMVNVRHYNLHAQDQSYGLLNLFRLARWVHSAARFQKQHTTI